MDGSNRMESGISSQLLANTARGSSPVALGLHCIFFGCEDLLRLI